MKPIYQGAEAETNDCDGHQVWWVCPSCKAQNFDQDIQGKLTVRACCNGCGAAFSIEIDGEYYLDYYGLELTPLDPEAKQ